MQSGAPPRPTPTPHVTLTAAESITPVIPEICLPESIIQTLCDITDFYLHDRIDPKWIKFDRMVKSTLNSVTQTFGLGAFFNTIQPERKRFCDQFKEDLYSTDIRSLCNVVIYLGKEAEEAYRASRTYSTFFLLAHAFRNILVLTIKENFPSQYDKFIEGLLADLGKVKGNIKGFQEKQQDVTCFLNQKKILKLNLAYLEHHESIWQIKKHYEVFNQPALLPSKAGDDQNKPFCFQPTFGSFFINSAYGSLLKCSLDVYIDNKELEFKEFKKKNNRKGY